MSKITKKVSSVSLKMAALQHLLVLMVLGRHVTISCLLLTHFTYLMKEVSPHGVEGAVCGTRYEANWESLDQRPLPDWYDDAKVGIFIHWGVFSVPSFGSEWFWDHWQGGNEKYVNFMKANYRPGFTYQDFAPQFTAEFFDPEHWAKVFQASGAKYVVLTSKHHEGYTLWPSKYSWSWNAMDVGPKRDLVGDLAAAIRSKTPDVRFGLYHSLFEWFNPLHAQDKANNLTTNNFITMKTMPELYELVNNYKPEVIWSDGDWTGPDWYWNSTVFLSWLFSDSPVKDTVVVNDRWGIGDMCTHGSFFTCADRYNPGVLQAHKWENCLTLDKESWGYRRNANATDYLTIHEILSTMAETISCGGNMLVNIGPTKEGTLPPIMEERLYQMGQWLGINGEAVYASQPWTHQNDTLTEGVWFTMKESAVYAFVLSWPTGDVLTLGSVQSTPNTKITMLGQESQPLLYKTARKGLQVVFPPMSEISSQWVWVLKMENV
ncbi:unnamed protein product, partial [Meganyctiphanes norvegica]